MNENIEYFFNIPLNLEDIGEVYSQAFQRKFNIDYWKWRFEQNPFSKKIYINYIKVGKDLAGYYAVSPLIVKINNQEYKIALSNMTMSNPKYQGNGYFKQLAKDMFQVLQKDGYIGVIGFANHNSHYGFRKYLNWCDLSILNIMSLNKNQLKLKTKENHFHFSHNRLNNEDIRLVSNMKFTNLSIHNSRNSEFLNWRLIQNPTQEYFCQTIYDNFENILGKIIYKIYNQQEIDIMEIFINPEKWNDKNEFYPELFNDLLSHTGAKINIWSNLFTEDHLILEKIGFLENSFNTYFGIIYFDNCEKNFDLISNIKNWHFRFLDSDLF